MVLAKLIQAAGIAASDHVLDVGCASGYSTALLTISPVPWSVLRKTRRWPGRRPMPCLGPPPYRPPRL
jgi:hypothetical protein